MSRLDTNMFLPGCPSLKKGFLYGQPCRYWFFAFINKHTFQYADDCFITSQHALCICHLVTALFFFLLLSFLSCAHPNLIGIPWVLLWTGINQLVSCHRGRVQLKVSCSLQGLFQCLWKYLHEGLIKQQKVAHSPTISPISLRDYGEF